MKEALLIAKWELLRSRARTSVRFAWLSILLSAALLLAFFFMLNAETNASREIYSAAFFGSDDFLEEALSRDGRFLVMRLSEEEARSLIASGRLDLLIQANGKTMIYYSRSPRSIGALSALEQAVKHNKLERISSIAVEQVSYAFPLWVETHYLEREQEFQYAQLGAQGGASPAQVEEAQRQLASSKPVQLETQGEEVMQQLRKKLTRKLSIATEKEVGITVPSLISPPMPFKSVLLAFLLALPIYLFSQFYSSSVVEERINKRAELLLASPIRARDVILGKTLPYFALILFASFILAFALAKEFNLIIPLVLLPVALFFLALSFFSALLSRSFKENTFFVISFSVVLFAYLYFPAMFLNVHAASSVSPMTLAAKILEKEEVALDAYLFTTLPFYLCSLLLFYFGGLIFREEELFSQLSPAQKIFSAFELYLSRARNRAIGTLVLASLLVPAVYLLELMLIVGLFQVPYPYSIYSMLALSALIEEGVKIAGVAAIARKISSLRIVLYSALSAAGFFLGEKLIAAVTLAQISESLFGSIMSMGGYLSAALLVHVAATTIASFGLVLSRGRLDSRFLAFLLLAALAHALYNLSVIGWLR